MSDVAFGVASSLTYIILYYVFVCSRCVTSIHDDGATRSAAVGWRRLVVSLSLPSTRCHGALVRLLPLPSLHEPHARRRAVPPTAAARHAGNLGQPEHRLVFTRNDCKRDLAKMP